MGMLTSAENERLTRVGKGTPMGELLRRYWHPVALSSDAGDTPLKIRALGEELVLFREASGRPGLLQTRCTHRGASLLYGRVEPRGIRCCYHGWLFSASGECLERPCEPDNGGAACARTPQPGYPVEELYGLIFAYMGPPAKKPLLPRYELLENLAEGEFLEADANSIGGGGPAIVPCNWLQHFENVMDPFHVPILHGSFSGTQFNERMNLMPQVEFETTERGILSTSYRKLPDGRTHRRVTEAVLPTVRVVANPRATGDGPCSLLGWVLPMDDTSFRIYSAGKVREKGDLTKIKSQLNGKLWSQLSPEEHFRFPGDYEAQVGQGAVAMHSEEHLTITDQGIGMLRRMLRRNVEAVARGEDPANTIRDPAAVVVSLAAGSSVVEAANPAT